MQVREQNRAAAADAAARKERQKKAAEDKRRAAESRRKVMSAFEVRERVPDMAAHLGAGLSAAPVGLPSATDVGLQDLR